MEGDIPPPFRQSIGRKDNPLHHEFVSMSSYPVRNRWIPLSLDAGSGVNRMKEH